MARLKPVIACRHQHWHASRMHRVISSLAIHRDLSPSSLDCIPDAHLDLSSSAPESHPMRPVSFAVASQHFLKQHPHSPPRLCGACRSGPVYSKATSLTDPFAHNGYDICGSRHVDCYIIYPSPLYRNFISWSCSSLGPHIGLF